MVGLRREAKFVGPREGGLAGDGVAFFAVAAVGAGEGAEEEEEEAFMIPAKGLSAPAERKEEVRVWRSVALGTRGVGGGFELRSGLRVRVERRGCRA